MNEGIKLTVKSLNKQKENGQIDRVIRNDNELKQEDFDKIIKQINNSRVIGAKYKKVQILFEIQTNLSPSELVKVQ